MSSLVVVSLNLSNINNLSVFNRTYNLLVIFNWAIFIIDLVPQYLTFRLSYVKFPICLSINEHSTHNNGQFDGCLIKIKLILRNLQGF